MNNSSDSGIGDYRPSDDQVATAKSPGGSPQVGEAVGVSDAINPLTLKTARKRRGLTQGQLARDIKCSKDTVSRWERGKSRRVRSHLRKPLCDALQVTWKRLTEPTIEQRQHLTGDVTTKVPIRKDMRASLQLVAVRYGVSPTEVVNLAPLLFLIVAERSLLTRERRLKEMNAVVEEAEWKLLDNSAHLGGIVCARSISADDILEQEKKSLSKRDVFGRIIEYQYRSGTDEGPFARYVRDLAKDLPKHAVTCIESFGGDMVETYRIAEDTLHEFTGITEDDENGKRLLHYIRCGFIDFAECLRVRHDGPEEAYRQWLSDELVRAESESKRELKALLDDIDVSPVIADALGTSSNGGKR